VHLRQDFPGVCEQGPRGRRDRARPPCARGPFFGYWQPRSWVALGIASASLVATGAFYGMAAAKRTQYRDALADDDEPRIAEYGARMRQHALLGDVAMAATGLALGVLVISVIVDRHDAKQLVRARKLERMLALTADRRSVGARVRLSF